MGEIEGKNNKWCIYVFHGKSRCRINYVKLLVFFLFVFTTQLP